MPASEAEADRRDRRPDDAAGHAVENLGREYEREAWPQRQNECRGRDQDKAARRQPPLPTDSVGERAAGDLRRHARQSTDGQREPDVLFRPTPIGQVESQKRAEAHLDVGQEKIRPIETPPAAIRYFPIAKFAPVGVLRDRPPRSAVKTEKPLNNSVSSGSLGSMIRGSFRTVLLQARRGTHRSCDSPLRCCSRKLLPTSGLP